MQSHFQHDQALIVNRQFKKTLTPKTEYLDYPPLSRANLNWWIEITTSKPFCIYYFGPFDSMLEAASLYSGYIEDLKDEGVPEQEISATIKLCEPYQLTVFLD